MLSLFVNLTRPFLRCVMRKPDFCLCENIDTDHSNCKADQRLCFRIGKNPVFSQRSLQWISLGFAVSVFTTFESSVWTKYNIYRWCVMSVLYVKKKTHIDFYFKTNTNFYQDKTRQSTLFSKHFRYIFALFQSHHTTRDLSMRKGFASPKDKITPMKILKPRYPATSLYLYTSFIYDR